MIKNNGDNISQQSNGNNSGGFNAKSTSGASKKWPKPKTSKVIARDDIPKVLTGESFWAFWFPQATVCISPYYTVSINSYCSCFRSLMSFILFKKEDKTISSNTAAIFDSSKRSVGLVVGDNTLKSTGNSLTSNKQKRKRPLMPSSVFALSPSPTPEKEKPSAKMQKASKSKFATLEKGEPPTKRQKASESKWPITRRYDAVRVPNLIC